MEDIWSDDAPRIIQGYTGHGITHCERLAGFVKQILGAQGGKKVTSEEVYLLLAGIYLHDIGMQCDVLRFPEIKAQAIKLGADFAVDFNAPSANNYSKEEQNSLRSNHQYLSAAWIEYAYSTGETVLGPAAKKIPSEYVDDLMDICKYHSKLPIRECPITFKLVNGRKQLVAVMLRFSDELDIDRHRVSIETALNFSLDPRNSFYWWLHNQTLISFNTINSIILTVRLHPDDFEKYKGIVYKSFIVEFQSKNSPVLGVLAQNAIPIVISDESKVVEDNRISSFPPEVVQVIEKMTYNVAPLTELANEIKAWLRAIRYEVTDPRALDQRTNEMVASLDIGTVKQQIMVRCVGGEIQHSDVESLEKDLPRKITEGWLITDRRISNDARTRAAEAEIICNIFSLSEFLQQKVWGAYFDRLTSLVEEEQLEQLYVDQTCFKMNLRDDTLEATKDTKESLDDYIDQWLSDRWKEHISILGDFGSGKTWFCHHYAQRQLKKYLVDPVKERLPLLITLRSFVKSMSAQQLINDALIEQYKLPFIGSAFEIFQEVNRAGKLLLILDGFDEMARQVDYQTVVDNFWELAKLVSPGSKVILTSRTEYFRLGKEQEKILHGEEFGRNTIVLSPPKFEVIHLEPFNDDQIREVIKRKLGAKDGLNVAEKILSTPNLAEMVRKPVLIDLLLAVLGEEENILENQAHVYLYATNKLLLRNIKPEKTFTSTKDKLFFLCELAWEMINSGELKIHYKDIPERIKSFFGDRIKDKHELDYWDFDLRNQTLLHRDIHGYYEFAHKSLAEFFVALKFAAELGCLAPVFKEMYCEEDGIACTIPFDIVSIDTASRCFGATTLLDESMSTICDFLLSMIDNTSLALNKLIDATRGKSVETVKYSGGNAATLLHLLGEKLDNIDFSGTNLSGAYLCGADLSNVSLDKCNLDGAYLVGAFLPSSGLSGALLNSTYCVIINPHIKNKKSVSCGSDHEWRSLRNIMIARMNSKNIDTRHNTPAMSVQGINKNQPIVTGCDKKAVEMMRHRSGIDNVKRTISYVQYSNTKNPGREIKNGDYSVKERYITFLTLSTLTGWTDIMR